MLRVAITGGIGSGKSYVCRLLEQRGISIYDCDRAAKHIMATQATVKKALTALVGTDVYNGDKLQKAVMAKYLLASADNAQRVNSIVHPAVARDFLSSEYQWMECAILFSSGFDRLVDLVVCVTAPREVRVGRIMQRDGITRTKAEEWIDCQTPQEEVARNSDFIIVNDGHSALEPQIDNILNELNKQQINNY